MKYLLILSLGCLLSSCTLGERFSHETAYVPNKMHVPLFDRKGQVQLEAAITSSFEFAGGYAFADNFAAVASARLKDEVYQDTNYYQNANYDIGLGYFYRNEREPYRIEGFVRVAMGSMNIIDQYEGSRFFLIFPPDSSGTLERLSFDYFKYFLQANVGFDLGSVVLMTSLRGGAMQLRNISRRINNIYYTDSTTLSTFTESDWRSFVDWGLSVQIEFTEQVALEIQFVMGEMSDQISLKENNIYGIGGLGLTCKF